MGARIGEIVAGDLSANAVPSRGPAGLANMLQDSAAGYSGVVLGLPIVKFSVDARLCGAEGVKPSVKSWAPKSWAENWRREQVELDS